MTNYIPLIASPQKKCRFETITKELKDHDVPFLVQKLPNRDSFGNIIVTFNPASDRKLVISAHYDNVPGTPGANDNAAACSILLNLIFTLKEMKTDKSLEFVFFDLEEVGFLGSQYYLYCNDKKSIEGVINLDMCGMGTNTMISTHNGGKKLLPNPMTHKVVEFRQLPPGDAYTFIDAGLPTLYVANSTDRDLDWYRQFALGSHPLGEMPDFGLTMHRPGDTPDTCNLDQVEQIFEFIFDCIKQY